MSTPDARRYSIGHLLDNHQIDLAFVDRAIAIAQIRQCSTTDTTVWAVWADDDGEILALAYAGQVFE